MEYVNLNRSELIQLSLKNENALLSNNGALCVNTGKHTGRAANDKFIVLDNQTKDKVDWTENNSFDQDSFNKLYGRVLAYLQDKDTYIQYLYAGTEVKLPFKLTTTSPRHAAFSTNMFYSLNNDKVQFELIHVPDFKSIPEIDNTNSEAFVILNFSKKIILIGGTGYSGEIKKSIFTAMNFILPQLGILPMHASVNENITDGNIVVRDLKNSCVFFGLSGTGKTTLSSDENRILIGDDECGWSDRGLFNFENGCYAKTIRLSKNNEPQIWDAINKFGSILENVKLNENREVDFNSNELTENTRGSYRLEDISNHSKTRRTDHPTSVVMLTYDSFGVLPPVSKLSVEQAGYYFMNGFTSRVAGTESGVTEPTAVFSACFGAPFLPMPALKYTQMFMDKVRKHGVDVYLVNTGLVGGPYGVGKRISIEKTRQIITAIIDGTLIFSEYSNNNPFKLNIPCLMDEPKVGAFNPISNEFIKHLGILNPVDMWDNKQEYYKQANLLIEKFRENFSKYKNVPEEIINAAL